MARTTELLVKNLLLLDYDSRRKPSLTPFITAANLMVTRVNTKAGESGITISTDELEIIERWLAAHLYQQSDQGYSSRSTSGASGSFQGQTGMRLESTKYGQTAMMIDPSGMLRAISNGQYTHGITWLGLYPTDQIDYDLKS